NIQSAHAGTGDAVLQIALRAEQSHLHRGGRRRWRKSAPATGGLFQKLPGEIAQAGFCTGRTAAARPARSAQRIRDRADAAFARLAHSRDHESGCSRARLAFDDFGRGAELAFVSPRTWSSGPRL